MSVLNVNVSIGISMCTATVCAISTAITAAHNSNLGIVCPDVGTTLDVHIKKPICARPSSYVRL